MKPGAHQAKQLLLGLQDTICQQLTAVDGTEFVEDSWQRKAGDGERSRVLCSDDAFKQAGVNFSHVHGEAMPVSAIVRRPEFAGRGFEAVSASLIVHPHDPYVPASHTSVRFLIAEKPGADPVWWSSGGFDLTPFYGFEEDAIYWRRTARDLYLPFGENVYPRYKKQCDEYFYLKHRNKQRSTGGLFFNDLNMPDFDHCPASVQAVGKSYTDTYLPIVERRKAMTYGERERDFQLYHHGRYVEFNLVWDHDTLFGLQTGGHTESILMSIPLLVRWEYDYQPKDGNPEAVLGEFIKVRDWVQLPHPHSRTRWCSVSNDFSEDSCR